MPVSVVIPAYGGQPKLDLTLAALSRQTYPSHLLEVVVVDDGSQPPIRLASERPENCQLVKVPDDAAGWGRAHACHTGAEAAAGEIIHWLDADMITYPDHVEAQVRWHHVLPEAVTIGYKRFIDADPPTPDTVVSHAEANRMDQLFPMSESGPHEWMERFIARRDGLRRGRSVYHVHVGATAALQRDLYRAAGGMDVTLRLGEDTELGYRLEQAGAVFIPEPLARSWHLGRSAMMRDGGQLRRYNRPFLEHRMPLYPGWRSDPGRHWTVPAVVVVIDATDQPAEVVEECVGRVLASYDDLRVLLVGPWDRLTPGRRNILADPDLDLRILRAGIGEDARVVLVTEPPATVFPSPLRLDVPAECSLGVRTISRLIDQIEGGEHGLIEATVPARGESTASAPASEPVTQTIEPAPAVSAETPYGASPTPDPDAPAPVEVAAADPDALVVDADDATVQGGDHAAAAVRLWRTSAVHRARRVMQPEEDLRAVVDEVWGAVRIDGRQFGVRFTSIPESGERNPLLWARLETADDVGALERRVDELSRRLAHIRTPLGWMRYHGAHLIRGLRRLRRRRTV